MPLPGLRGDLVAWVSAAHPGGCNPAAAARTNNLIATTHDNERTCGTFDSKSAPSPANGAPNRVPATGHHVARVARVAWVSAAHPGGCNPAVFQWQRFIHRRANPPFFNGTGSSIAVRTPGAGVALTRATWRSRSLGKRSAPGGMQPRRFQWHRLIHRRATPPFFNGTGSSIAVQPRRFSMATVHPSPCNPALFQWHRLIHRRANPGCGRCPYPGYVAIS